MNSKVITNLSNYHCSDNGESSLKNGFYFAIPPENLIKTNILVPFGKICYFLTSDIKDK